MRKAFILAIAVVSIFGTLIGCDNNTAVSTEDENKLNIVTTTFPEYDWVCQILGEETENIEVTMLMDSSVDMHNFQPSAEDLSKLANCDLFIYNGGESYEWVNSALASIDNEDLISINLMDILGNSLLTIEHNEEAHEHEEEHGEISYDEHIWLSLRNAKIICNYLAEQIAVMDMDNAKNYRTNVETYISELDNLNAQYEEIISSAKYDTLIFADRYPFRYLANDYGLDCYAAFSGCSAETEASFETIISLADKVDELGLVSVMIIDGSDESIADTVINATNTKDQAIFMLDSMQSVTNTDINNGITYLSVMENNLEVLKDALN